MSKRNKKKQKANKLPGDSSESEQENEYVNDGFVVNEEEDQDQELDQIEQVSKDSESDKPLSEDDLDLIAENKLLEQRKGRLHKQEEFEEDQERSQDQIEPISDELHIEEEIEEIDQNELVRKLYDPTQRETDFYQEVDEEIIKSNVPESIQLTYMRNNEGKLLTQYRNEVDDQQLKWTAERLCREFNFSNKTEHQDIVKGVKFILDAFRKEHLEIMYIYTYKKHLITQQLKLEHYWRIRELDAEWEQFLRFKQKIDSSIVHLPIGPYTPTMMKLQQTAVYLEELQNLKDYVDYIHMKIRCRNRLNGGIEEELQNLSIQHHKYQRKERQMMEFMKYRIDEAMMMFAYTADEYFEVLQGNRVELKREMFSRRDQMANKYVDPQIPQIRDITELWKFMLKYYTLELYHHPYIRDYVATLYRQHVLISTEPTPLGNREINALSYLFPVKRIKNRPLKYMEDQIFLMALKAEEQGFIKIIFQISRDLDHKQTEKKFQKNDIEMALIERFQNIGNDKEEESLTRLRDFVLRSLLNEQWYPILERQTRNKLKQAATKHVVKLCQKQFRSLINQQPHQSEEQSQKEEIKIMSLVLGNEQNTNKSLQTYTMDCTVAKKFIGMAIIDAKGEPVQLHVFNYLNVDKRRDDLAENSRKEKAILDKFFEVYKPDLVVISANHADCLRLRADLRDQFKSSRTWITVAESTIPHIYSLSEQSKLQHQELPQILKEAISLARYKLNPQAEVLNLWNEKLEKNGCLHINYHPLQGMISKEVLSDALQQVSREIVNSVGIDLVDCTLHKHLSEQVQFINGLGPRQSRHLLQMFKGLISKALYGNNFESEKLILQKLSDNSKPEYIHVQRRDILITQIFGKSVFKNMEGFVRIGNGIQPLDSTRLYTKMYSDAIHIAKCALDVQGKDDKQNTVIRQLMENPQKINDLELEDWALKKEQREGSENFTEVVHFIRQELTTPFHHNYESKNREMTNPEIFYAVTQESQYTFKRNSIVQGVVVKKWEDGVLVKLSDNGLIGSLRKEEIEQPLELNAIVKAYVKKINALEKQQDDRNQNLLRVDLTMRADWNLKEYVIGTKPDVWLYNISFEEYSERVKSTFDFQKAKEQDLPIVKMPPVVKQQQKLILRNINHPKFKQVLLKGALEYIQGQPIGEYIIRPNAKFSDHLTITWKFYTGVIAHLYVQEVQRPGSFKPSLFLNGEPYESFDEIYERYLVPCNSHMETVANYKKFNNGTIEQLEKKLREEKEKDEEIIPYGYCVTEKAPQYVVLMYMKDRNKVEKEFIKVKPDGLSFHQIIHHNLINLTQWFKYNFRSQEYKNYVRRTKAPFLDNDRLGLINQQWEVKKEKVKDEKLKYEEQNSYNVSCSKCGKRGHNANDCRQDKYDRGTRDNNNNNNNNNSNRGCHNCGQNGHIKKNCPQLTKRRERSNSRDREKGYQRKAPTQPKIEETQIDY